MCILQREFSDFILKNKLSGCSVIVALSGGVDSMSLLHVSCRILGHDSVRAVYVNHKIREESELSSEIRLCSDFCRNLGVNFTVTELGDGEVDSYARTNKSGIEASARILRYQALISQAHISECPYIMTAHHADDALETVLMSLLRGGSLRSYGGINSKVSMGDITVFRPFLKVSKKNISDYAEKNGIVYSTDSTNKDLKYTRNFVRNALIPHILTNPDFKIEQVTRILNRFSAVRTDFSGEINSCKRWIDTDAFCNMSKTDREEALFLLWNSIFTSRELPKTLIDRVSSQVFDIRLNSSKNSVVVSSNFAVFTITHRVVLLTGKNDCFENLKDFYKIAFSNNGDAERDIFLDRSVVENGVSVTSACENEYITLRGCKKKIFKLFQEMKIPSTLRRLVPVLRKNGKIIAVFGSVFGCKNRISEEIFTNCSTDSVFVKITCLIFPNRI